MDEKGGVRTDYFREARNDALVNILPRPVMRMRKVSIDGSTSCYQFDILRWRGEGRTACSIRRFLRLTVFVRVSGGGRASCRRGRLLGRHLRKGKMLTSRVSAEIRDVPSPPLSDCKGISNSSRVHLRGSWASSWRGSMDGMVWWR